MKLTSFIATLATGVAVGLLLAPKKGEELRKDLTDKTQDTFNKFKEMSKEDFEATLKNTISDLKQVINDFDFDEFKENSANKLNELKIKIEDLYNQVQENDNFNIVKEKVSVIARDVTVKFDDIKQKITNKNFNDLSELDDEIDEIDDELNIIIDELKDEE